MVESIYNELEIYLFKPERDRYMVALRFTDPDNPASQPPVSGWTALAAQDEQAAHGPLPGVSPSETVSLVDLALEPNPGTYGKMLTDSLLADSDIEAFLEKVRSISEGDDKDLRLRLFIDPSAQELQDLHWETLCDPRDETWLAANPQLPFSRFLTSPSWKPVRLRKQTDLRALIVVADPQELATGDYLNDNGESLAPVNVDGELQRARDGLGAQIHIDELASDHNAPRRVTLTAIENQLDQGEGYDILYLVCHGVYLTRREPPGPYILLEKDDGGLVFEPGTALARLLRDLPDEKRPRLVALASCQSGGAASDVKGSLARLGPLLAQAGVPAVLAMQGDVTQETVAAFMPEFFKTLRETGLVDLAAAKGRVELEKNQRPDRWMPVMYHRLRDARLWYTPQVSGERSAQLWRRLFNGLANKGLFVPVIGPGLSEYLCGPLHLAAREMAEQQNFPLRESSREEIQHIAQYLAKRDGRAEPAHALVEYYLKQANKRFGPQLAGVVAGSSPEDTLANQLAEICRQRIQMDPMDAYSVLAHLQFKVYVNANPDNLLEQALIEAGRPPVVDYARWKPELLAEPSEILEASSSDKPYDPSVKKPLLYHMFGNFRSPGSLVLTEEDYLNYLLWISKAEHEELRVSSHIMQPGLLFVGFGALDWNFRVLYRSLQFITKGERAYKSIAVQVTPGEEIIHPELARFYLQQYLGEAQVGVYWGSVRDFIEELWEEAEKWDNQNTRKVRL